jgi:hypothetical protein
MASYVGSGAENDKGQTQSSLNVTLDLNTPFHNVLKLNIFRFSKSMFFSLILMEDYQNVL